jgi:rod shape-determining protein MreD
MRLVRYVFLLLLAFVLQTTWLGLLELASFQPDLILLVLIHIALRDGPLPATFLGLGIGFLQDVYMPADLGLNALLKVLVGFAAGYGRTRVVADNIQVQVALVFGAVLAHDLLYYLLSSAVSLVQVPFFWLRYGVGRALYTGLLGALFSAALVLRRYLFPA